MPANEAQTTRKATLRVGFIGMGEMGYPMASRLREAGWSLVVTDASAAKRDSARTDGFDVEVSTAAVAKRSDIVLVMVPGRRVAGVVNGADGLLETATPGSIVIDGGNSDPANSVAFADKFSERGVHFLDVGFSGGPLGAASGTLAVMAGGNADAFQTALPVLRELGREIGYFGVSGNGHLAKAINHLVQGLTAQAIGEALAIAEAAGINQSAWARVAAGGAAGSWLMDRTREMLDHDAPEPDALTTWWQSFGVRNQLAYSNEAATALGVPVPLAAVGQQIRSITGGEGRTVAMDNYLRLTWELAHGRHQ